jgi:CheY-like chemotaxis protein
LKAAVDTLVSVFKGQPLLVAGAITATEAKYLFGLLSPELVITSVREEWLPLIAAFRSTRPALEIIGVTDSDQAAQIARRSAIENIVLIGADPDSWATGIQPALGSWLSAPQPRNDVTILLVDDEVETLEFLANDLSLQGYTVQTAESGKAALDMVEHDPSISLVILDIVMPQMGGLETLQRLKYLRPDLDFVMLSAFADRAIVREAFTLGAFDFLLKPIDTNLLENSITACLARAAFRRRSWWRRRAARQS